MRDAVGPVLRMCDELEHVIEAMVEDNPGREVQVIGHGSYVRVQATGFLHVTLASLRRNVGASFQMRQLEAMMSAFAGRIATSTDEITWTLTTADRATDEGAGT